MIPEETKQHSRNLLMMWFGYKRASDLVPQDSVVKAVELAQNIENNLHDQIINGYMGYKVLP